MSYLEVGGRRYPIETGEMTIGSDPGGQIVISGLNVAPRHALVRATPDGQVSIYKPDDTVDVLVNGVRMGAQPTPLLHGDKVVIGGYELRFGDERRSGSTQFMHVDDSAFAPPGGSAGSPGGGSAAGGRLVSLTDGREYSIGGGSLVVGRSTDCDVVLTNRNVSRRHAEIIESPKGYLLVDSSTNGCFVNGDRIQGQQLLDRGDVIRIGDDEFRFYADPVKTEAQAEPPAPQETAVQEAERDPFLPDPAKARGEGRRPEVAPPPPPPGAEQQLRDTLFGVPGVKIPGITRGAPPEVESAKRPPSPPPAPKPPVAGPVPKPPPAAPAPRPPAAAPASKEPQAKSRILASLVVRTGDLKGKRFAIQVPIANIGRAEYNDVVIADGSVSTSHAKLQRREGIWVLVDLDSTNGTRVDGEQLRGEAPLAPGAKIQFGNVEVLFEPTDDSASVQEGGGTQLIDKLPLPEPPPTRPAQVPPEPDPPTPRELEGPAPEWSVVAQPSEPTDERAEPDSQLFTRLVWGLLVLVVLAVLIIVFAG